MLVGTLLTALTLAILQLGFAVYVRNVVHDAAAEGAHHAALADVSLGEGAELTRVMISRAVGSAFAQNVAIARSTALGHPTIEVRVRTTLPLLGLIGIAQGWEVTAHAPQERFDE